VGLRIQRYLEYAYNQQRQKVQAKDCALLNLLSKPLEFELKHETLAVHLVGHPLFQQIATRLRVFYPALAEISLARNDSVFSCGEYAVQMFFVAGGRMEYLLGECEGLDIHASKDLDALEDALEGEWICEAVLWTPWLHLGDLHAARESQLITINAAAFGDSVRQNKPMWLGLRRYAEKFVRTLNKIEREDLTDLLHQVLASQEIIDEADFRNEQPLEYDEEELDTTPPD
jgi:hypothetical protein